MLRCPSRHPVSPQWGACPPGPSEMLRERESGPAQQGGLQSSLSLSLPSLPARLRYWPPWASRLRSRWQCLPTARLSSLSRPPLFQGDRGMKHTAFTCPSRTSPQAPPSEPSLQTPEPPRHRLGGGYLLTEGLSWVSDCCYSISAAWAPGPISQLRCWRVRHAGRAEWDSNPGGPGQLLRWPGSSQASPSPAPSPALPHAGPAVASAGF